ncbi:MAG: response regulator, partial [Candidatus Omnitrophica bacterium]|nr:response regulator [Candidatus Omnitrophota bacterium]
FWVTSGSKAIAELARDFFKVVFLDIRLADINGIEVLRAVKKNSPLTRIVVISATQPERLKEDWRSEGTFTYLGKPFDIEKVLRILEDMGKGTENGKS